MFALLELSVMLASDPLPSGLYQKLTGTIPSDIGLLVFLKTLTLYNNTFTGKVPSEIGGLSQLIWFWSHTNASSFTAKGGFLCVCSATTSHHFRRF